MEEELCVASFIGEVEINTGVWSELSSSKALE